MEIPEERFRVTPATFKTRKLIRRFTVQKMEIPEERFRVTPAIYHYHVSDYEEKRPFDRKSKKDL